MTPIGSTITKCRPNYLDYAKVIGIYLVILGHYAYHFNLPFEHNLLWKLEHSITLFHMPLFFIISGVLMKEGKSVDIAKKVMKRLLVPYLLICSICFVMGFLIWYFKGNEITIYEIKRQICGVVFASDFPKYSLFDQFSGAMWFCIALAWIQLFFGTSGMFLRIFAAMGGVILMRMGNVLPLRFDSALVGFVFFTIGFYGKAFFLKIATLKDYVLLTVLISAVVALVISAAFNMDFDKRQALSINAMFFGKFPLLFLISGVAGTIAVMVISSWIAKLKVGKKVILTISNGTIIVLGFHKIITILLRDVITVHNVPTAIVYSFFNLAICYILIIAFKRYFPIILGGRT